MQLLQFLFFSLSRNIAEVAWNARQKQRKVCFKIKIVITHLVRANNSGCVF